MSGKLKKDKDLKSQEKFQAVLSSLLREENNKYCVDCDAKAPRWASWNLGVFLCIRCAGIHRNLGVHISRVKSINLDTWTEEQIDSVENVGNTLGRKIYEANLPTTFRRPQTDSALENFIRDKYDRKRYMDKSIVPTKQKKKEDRDAEKEKKRANRKTEVKSQVPLSVVAKPRQHSAKPAPVIAQVPVVQPAAPKQPPPPVQNSAAVDLLGLANGPSLAPTTQDHNAPAFDLLGLASPTEDPLVPSLQPQPSACPPTVLIPDNPQPKPVSQTSTNDASNEDNLFGDEVNGKAAQKTKDSIMALFDSGSAQQQPFYNVPGGVYIPQQQQQQQQQPQQFMMNGTQPQQGMMGNGAMSGYLPQATHAATGVNAQPMMNSAPMMGKQGMVPNPNMMTGQTMMSQQGMMGQMYGGQNPQLYLQQNYQVQQMRQAQQFQQLQQVQQQLQNMGLNANGQAQGNWVQPGIPAAAGGSSHGTWGQDAGQTLSTNLWK